MRKKNPLDKFHEEVCSECDIPNRQCSDLQINSCIQAALFFELRARFKIEVIRE